MSVRAGPVADHDIATVSDMFPDVPSNVVKAVLRDSGSVEHTVDALTGSDSRDLCSLIQQPIPLMKDGNPQYEQEKV
jgi:hypothetical protein